MRLLDIIHSLSLFIKKPVRCGFSFIAFLSGSCFATEENSTKVGIHDYNAIMYSDFHNNYWAQ